MNRAILQTDGTWKIEEYTSEETVAMNKVIAEDQAAVDAMKAAATKKATDKVAGKAKLKELGLTDDQIEALIK